jgi:hypothetical protein
LVVAVASARTLLGVAASSSEAAGRGARPYDVNGDGYGDLVVGVANDDNLCACTLTRVDPLPSPR